MGFEVASEGVVRDPELQSHAGRSRLTSTSSTLMCRTLADRFCVNLVCLKRWGTRVSLQGRMQGQQGFSGAGHCPDSTTVSAHGPNPPLDQPNHD